MASGYDCTLQDVRKGSARPAMTLHVTFDQRHAYKWQTRSCPTCAQPALSSMADKNGFCLKFFGALP